MGWFWADSPANAAAAGTINVPHAIPDNSNAKPPVSI